MGMGNRKRETRKIEDKQALQVTFSKRKKGLFKKAEKLSLLTGASVLIVVFSPADRPFIFGDEGLIQLYLEGEMNIPEAVEDEDHLSLDNINLEYSGELELFLANPAYELNATKPASEQQMEAAAAVNDGLMETEEEGNTSSTGSMVF